MNMFKFRLLFCIVLQSVLGSAQLLDLPRDSNYTREYDALLDAYRELSELSEHAVLIELGISDFGMPIHAFVMSAKPLGEVEAQGRIENSWVLAINNGIHPGESSGVDASLEWANAVLENPSQLGNAQVVIIPMYNIGGAFNRSCCTRANQNGPANQGFRGNARNFDLNRDLIKCDTKNTSALHALFNRFDPDVFVDTHATNGADYPYDMTIITSPADRYPLPMQELVKRAEIQLIRRMNERGVPTVPYVNVFGRVPDTGFPIFLEGPMYTTGYSSLHGTISFVAEAHMWKPYETRVAASRVLIESAHLLGEEMGQQIRRAKQKVRESDNTYYTTNWTVNNSEHEPLEMNLYGYHYEESKVTGEDRLKYDQDRVRTSRVRYFNQLMPVDSVRIPVSYYIPVGQWEALATLHSMGVPLDTVVVSEEKEWISIKIESCDALDWPYEGHFLWKEVTTVEQSSQAEPGEYVRVVPRGRYGRVVLETLEPTASSSFFRWNYFDTYLQQKEHYSSYVFEDTAEKMLAEDAELAASFEAYCASNPEATAREKLDFIYKQSPYYEPEHMRIPIFKAYVD